MFSRLRRTRGARRPAVDARRADTQEEDTVEASVPALHGPEAGGVVQLVHGTILHADEPIASGNPTPR